MTKPSRYQAGSIYYLAEEQVRLPGEEERFVHLERRPVLVVSDQNEVHGTNAQPSDIWPSVLVVPISHSTKFKTRFDILIPAGEGNLVKKGWARVPALQMVDKDRLEDMTGLVRPETLDAVTAQILNYLGVLERATEEEEEPEFRGD